MSTDPATNSGPEEKPIEAGEVGELRDIAWKSWASYYPEAARPAAEPPAA